MTKDQRVHDPQRPASGVRRALAVVLLASAACSPSDLGDSRRVAVPLPGHPRRPGPVGAEPGLPPVLASLRMGAAAGRGCSPPSARPTPSTAGTRRSTGSPSSSPRPRPSELAGNPRSRWSSANEVRPLAAHRPLAPSRSRAGRSEPGRRRHRDRRGRLRHRPREPRSSPTCPSSARARPASTAPAPTASAGTPTPATASSWRPSGSWPASARTTCGPPPALSPRDTDGHGTQMASIAAGNSGVTVGCRVTRPVARQLRRHGAAGQARGLQGVLGSARPGRRRLRHRRPGDRDRPGHPRRRRRAQPRRSAAPTELDTVERALLGRRRGRLVVVAPRRQRRLRGVRRPPEPVGDHRRRHHRRHCARAGRARLGRRR